LRFNVILRYDLVVPRAANLEVLLALLGTSVEGAIDGDTVIRRLAAGGRTWTASALLVQLLALESSGHVEVSRQDSYRFALTPFGEEAAYELGPGDPINVVLVMVDLVGFVAFTAEQGDNAAHQVARQLQDLGDAELRRAGGKLVKPLGDGFLGTVRTPDEGVGIVRRVAQRCLRPDGHPWPLRAAVHVGRPISFRGDLFGADVNLTARLCSAARPGELVMTTVPGDPTAEALSVRGLNDPIAVTRMVVP
jgi:class 3 adenylate cyclase